jgi:hypothetical protein
MNSTVEHFLLEDLSSSDDSDIEEFLHDDKVDNLVLVAAVMKHKDGKQRKSLGLTVGRLCIPRNQAPAHSMLMRDYFGLHPVSFLL